MADSINTVRESQDPRPFGDQLVDILCDGRARAAGRKRLLRKLDAQINALALATETDIERVRQEAQKLVVSSELLLAVSGILSSARDPQQLKKVQRKVADLKAVLAAAVPSADG